MKSHQLIMLITIISSLAGTFLSSKTLAKNSDDHMPHYEVEVILYKNIKVPSSKEYALPISYPAKNGEVFDLSLSSSIEADIKKQYKVVPEIILQLTDMAKKITRSPRYEVLKHFAWRQPGLEKSQTIPVWIKAGRHFGNQFITIDDEVELWKANQSVRDLVALSSLGSEQKNLDNIDETASFLEHKINGLYEVEGKITVTLSKYLHVYTHLLLRKPRSSLDPKIETFDLDSQSLLYENLTETKILNNHRLKEHRRMRSHTLHYIDSPEFSMLILITPYKIPVELPDDVLQEGDLTKSSNRQ